MLENDNLSNVEVLITQKTKCGIIHTITSARSKNQLHLRKFQTKVSPTKNETSTHAENS